MSTIKTLFCSLVSFAAITASAWEEGELVAYFPFDGDCLSKVNTDKNPERVIYYNSGNVEFSDDVKCSYVHENLGVAPRANMKSIHFTFPGSVTIDMTEFGLGTDCTRLTCEFFFKAVTTWAAWGTWTMMARLGVANEITAETGAPSFDNPQLFYVQNNGSSQFYGAVFNQDGVKTDDGKSYKSVSGSFNKSILDNTWHHAVLVIDGSNASKIRAWINVDYGTTKELTALEGYGWRVLAPGEGKRLYLQLGTSANKTGDLYIDEMRIFAGINATTAFQTASAPYACFWLRQIENKDLWENIADGAALLYCIYDQSFGTSAFDNWPVQSLSGSKTYCTADEVIRGAGREIWTKDRTERIRGLNTGALKDSSTWIEAGMYALRSPNLKSCTIEWLMRCSSDYSTFVDETKLKNYQTLLGFASNKDPYPFYVQLTSTNNVEGARRYYLRLDCTKLRDGGTPSETDRESAQFTIPTKTAFWNDGKWHHFAVTVSEPDATTGRQTFGFYVDYEQLGTASPKNYCWDGMRPTDFLRFSNGVWIDELRISKGVLPVGKFLSSRGLGGIQILLK